MKKTTKRRFFLILPAMILLLSLVVVLTGKFYVYKALIHTTADIDDYKIFPNREIEAGEHQPWPLSANYNNTPLPAQHLEKIEEFKTVAFLVIRDSSILYEKYWDGYGPDAISNSFSMAKTIVSILTGIAIDEGSIKSPDQAIGDFLPEFNSGDKKKITVKHLLTMSSGLNWDESYGSLISTTTEAYYGTDLRKLALDQKVIEVPGQKFNYLSGNTLLLSFVLEAATGKNISEYASEKLWKPMGAKNTALWSLDKENGDEKSYCCFNSNARDFARFGQLYLNNGRWGTKQLVPERYVIESITPANLRQEDGKPLDHYGYSWWIMEHRDKYIFYARGILGQYIIVIPDKQLVIVRLGHERSDKRINDHPEDVYTYIEAGLYFTETVNGI